MRILYTEDTTHRVRHPSKRAGDEGLVRRTTAEVLSPQMTLNLARYLEL